jgi:hypothetical protein
MRWLVVTYTFAILVSGCTIAELQREEKADAERVRLKQASLQSEQERTDALNGQKDQLTAELSKHQVSLAELNARLDQLQATNARESSANDAVRLERQRLVVRLHELNAQLAALQQSPDTAATQKQEHIEYLKQEIRTQLDLWLH